MLTDITNKQSSVVVYPARRIVRAWKRSLPTDVKMASEYLGPTRALALQMSIKDFVLTMHSPGVLENMRKILRRVILRANKRMSLSYEQRLMAPSTDIDTKLFLGAYLVSCFPAHTFGSEPSVKDRDFQRAGALMIDAFDAVLESMRAGREPDYAAFMAGATAYINEAKTWESSPRLVEEFGLIHRMVELEKTGMLLDRMLTPEAEEAAIAVRLQAGKLRVQLRKLGGQPAIENADLRLCLIRMP